MGVILNFLVLMMNPNSEEREEIFSISMKRTMSPMKRIYNYRLEPIWTSISIIILHIDFGLTMKY